MLSLAKVVDAHDDGVMCLAAWERHVDESGSTKCVLSGGMDGMVKVWTADGVEASDKKCHRETVNKIMIPKDAPWNGEFVVTAGDDGFVKVWGWEAGAPSVGKKLAEAKEDGGINAMIVATDNFIATSNDSGEVSIYEATLSVTAEEDGAANKACTLKQVNNFVGSMEAINALLFVGNGLWTGGDDGFLRRWEVDDIDAASDGGSDAAEAKKEEAVFTSLAPTCNLPALEVGQDVNVMVNVFVHQPTPKKEANPYGFLWCSVAAPQAGASLWQKRHAVEGYVLLSFQTSDWARALLFPSPRTAVTAQDDGKILFFPVADEEDPAEMSEKNDIVVPEFTPVPDCPDNEVMDLVILGDLAVSTSDTTVRFWQYTA